MINRENFNLKYFVSINRYRFVLFSPVFLGIGILIGLKPFPIQGAYLLTALSGIIFKMNRRWGSLTVRLISGVCFWVALGWVCGFSKTTYFSSNPIIRSQDPKIMTAQVLNAERTQYGIRLTLKDLETKKNVRLTYRRKKPADVNVGDTIQAKIKLMPHKRAIYPGGFNFREKNRYEGIIATGALLSDPIVIDPYKSGQITNR